MDPLRQPLARLAGALAGKGARFESFVAASGSLVGEFEVRAADGRVRRMQPATLPLPPPLARAFALAAPAANVPVDMGSHVLTLWAPAELIELQVGYRWHGFNGKRMREWDERFVVFAEDGGDPLALRLDEVDGPVWLSHRGEGRHDFFEAAPSLADFYECLALWLETKAQGPVLENVLRKRWAERASSLWLWRQMVSGEEARR